MVGISDLFAMFGGNQEPEKKTAPPKALEQYFSGNAGNDLNSGQDIDFNKYIDQMSPKDRKRQGFFDMSGDDKLKTLGMVGKNLLSANKNNTNNVGVGALLGQAVGDTDTQQEQEFLTKQKGMQELIRHAQEMAKSGRDYKYTKQKDESELDYKNRHLASDDNYKRGMLGIHQGQLNQGSFAPLGQDAEGNAIVMDRKTGEIINQGKVTLGGKGGRGAPRTTIPVGMQGQLDKAFDTIIGAKGINGKPVDGVSPLDPELKKELSSEAADLVLSGQANSADDAVLKIMQKRGGVHALQEMTKPGMLGGIFGDSKAGFRNFGGMSTAPSMGAPTQKANDPFGFRD